MVANDEAHKVRDAKIEALQGQVVGLIARVAKLEKKQPKPKAEKVTVTKK